MMVQVLVSQIVKPIVENHNGVITASGELNKGATFDIYIPAP